MTTAKPEVPSFPFAALVGQERLALGLLLNAVDPAIGGILIRGQKGTAKSTAARSLAALLPDIRVVANCPCHCDPSDASALCPGCRSALKAGHSPVAERMQTPFVNLPLNASEDRVVGSIDFEHALRTGSKAFQPGLLCEANRGILYVDEVNLLEDHLVDILLDAAATGISVVEREGISFVHPARFILVASMNPEEGDIRPQLLDRFGLAVAVAGSREPEQRVHIARRREAFEANPEAFVGKWRARQNALGARIVAAHRRLGEVIVTQRQVSEIVAICQANEVAGHRADILLARTARALAAWHGRRDVERADIVGAAQMVLLHRSRRVENIPGGRQDGVEPSTSSISPQGEADKAPDKKPRPELPQRDASADAPPGPPAASDSHPKPESANPGAEEVPTDGETEPGPDQVFGVGDAVPISTGQIGFARDKRKRRTGRRRTQAETRDRTGRYVRATSERLDNDLAFDATLRAAAPHQLVRRQCKPSLGGPAVVVEENDLRIKVRQRRTSSLLLFVVDASGSMGTALMTAAKGAILALLLEAYQKRDRVGLVAFKGEDAAIVLPPTNSIEMAKKLLEELPTGGKTPLGAGLVLGYQLLKAQLRRDPGVFPLMILLTDGRANVGMDPQRNYEGPQFGQIHREIDHICGLFRAEDRVRSVVIDAEPKGVSRLDRAEKLARALCASYHVLEQMAGHTIFRTVERETYQILSERDQRS